MSERARTHPTVAANVTNVVKHADGATTIAVGLDWMRDKVAVAVADDGRSAWSADAASGLGLAGIRERASVYNGTVVAGPAPSGGWAVTVTLCLAGLGTRDD